MNHTQPPAQPNRLLAGVLAGLCLLGGLAVGVLDSFENMWCGTLVRTGLVLGPLWLVMPRRGEAGFWTKVSWVHLVILMISLWVIVRRPIVLLPLFLGLFLLSAFSWGPNSRKGPR